MDWKKQKKLTSWVDMKRSRGAQVFRPRSSLKRLESETEAELRRALSVSLRSLAVWG